MSDDVTHAQRLFSSNDWMNGFFGCCLECGSWTKKKNNCWLWLQMKNKAFRLASRCRWTVELFLDRGMLNADDTIRRLTTFSFCREPFGAFIHIVFDFRLWYMRRTMILVMDKWKKRNVSIRKWGTTFTHRQHDRWWPPQMNQKQCFFLWLK